MLDQPAKLGRILVGMNRALGEIPLTLKVRTGVKDGRNTAHRLMPRVGPEFGAGAITVSTNCIPSCFNQIQCRDRSTAVPANNGIPNLRIGTTSNNVLKRSERQRRTMIVSLIHVLMWQDSISFSIQCLRFPSSVVGIVIPQRVIGMPSNRVVWMA